MEELRVRNPGGPTTQAIEVSQNEEVRKWEVDHDTTKIVV